MKGDLIERLREVLADFRDLGERWDNDKSTSPYGAGFANGCGDTFDYCADKLEAALSHKQEDAA